VQSTRAEDFEKAIQPNTRLIYFESPSNPLLEIIDIAALAEFACARNPLHGGQYLCLAGPPAALNLGITVVVHSATKYLCGHGDAMAPRHRHGKIH